MEGKEREEAVWLRRKGLAGVLERSRDGGDSSAQYLSNGDVKLADFRQLLVRSGFHAEFMDGGLVVESSVIVRRGAAHKLLVEGTYGRTYFGVRKLLYDQFQLV